MAPMQVLHFQACYLANPSHFLPFYHQKRHRVSGNLPMGAAMTLNLELAVETQEKNHEAVTSII